MQLTTSPRLVLPAVIVAASIAVGGGLLARDAYDASPTAGTVEGSEHSNIPADQQPGPTKVQLTRDATKHPLAGTVRNLLQTYMDGINNHDYESWKTAVTAEKAHDQTRKQWEDGYRTTKNGSAVVSRIEVAAPNRVLVLLSFTSTQDPTYAPVTFPKACIRWRQALPIVREQGLWKVASTPPGSRPDTDEC